MNVLDFLNGGLMGGAATPGINGPSPAQDMGGLMSDPRKMMLLQMGANMLDASQGQPGQGRPGLGGILGAGARGALQGGMMANQMQMQQAQMGIMQDKIKRQKENEKRYEEFVQSPDFQQLPQQVQQAIQAGGPEMLEQYYKGNVEQASKGPPDAVRQYEYAREQGFGGSFADWKQQNARAGASSVNVKLPTLENEYDKSRGKFYADSANQIDTEALGASGRMGQLDRMDAALSNPNVYTGTAGETITGLKRAAGSLGFDVEGVPDAEVAQAVGNQMALELRNPSGGAGMPGALSDKDREFLVASVPGLGKTPAGNKLLLGYYKKVEKRKVEVAKLLRDYEIRNGRVGPGFYQELAEFSARNPLFTEADLRRAREIERQNPQRNPGAGTPWDAETQSIIDKYAP